VLKPLRCHQLCIKVLLRMPCKALSIGHTRDLLSRRRLTCNTLAAYMSEALVIRSCFCILELFDGSEAGQASLQAMYSQKLVWVVLHIAAARQLGMHMAANAANLFVQSVCNDYELMLAMVRVPGASKGMLRYVVANTLVNEHSHTSHCVADGGHRSKGRLNSRTEVHLQAECSWNH